MISTELIFALTGVGLFALGLRGTLLHTTLLARILALNVCGAGVFLMFVATAYQGRNEPTDPVPHALLAKTILPCLSITTRRSAIASSTCL